MPHRAIEAYGKPEFSLSGLSIWVHGRQFPDATDSWDSNWLRITAHYHGDGSSVTVTGAELDTVSFLRFRNELRRMAVTLEGEARLESVEPSVRLTMKFADAIGHIGARLELTPDHLSEGHWYSLDELDQSHIPSLLVQLDAIVEEYPVKQPSERGV
jgi:hypothetical protein